MGKSQPDLEQKTHTTPTDLGQKYLRIAAVLRTRCAALPEGARAPSTREVMSEFKVAIATANRALAQLCQEGVLRAVPRIGYTAARAKPTSTQEAHPRDRVVQAAASIADKEGLDALSMRSLAAKLDVSPMSIYRHVRDKDELLLLLIDAVFAEELLPPPPKQWRVGFELLAKRHWALYRRHPWLARLMPITRPLALEKPLAHLEWMLRVMQPYGLDAATQMRLHITLYSYVRGMATNIEDEMKASAESGMDEDGYMQKHDAQFIALGSRYPAFGRLLSELQTGFDMSLDDMFLFGLKPLLDGFARFF